MAERVRFVRAIMSMFGSKVTSGKLNLLLILCTVI